MSISTDSKKPSSAEPADHLRRSALDYHEFPTPGKITVTPTKPLLNQRDLALAYTPGVAAACEAINGSAGRCALYRARQSGGRVDQWNGGAGSGRYRSAGIQTGNGRQGGAFQEIRGHRCVRY